MYRPLFYNDLAFLGNLFRFDLDAIAFLTAAGITDPLTKEAINNLVIGLKNTEVWGKMIAIYPFAGNTASTHKWNLKDPRDLDAAFRLTFSGGITHLINGVQGNGTNAYYQTYINPANNFSQNNASGWVWSKTDSLSGVDFGAFGSSLGFQLNSRNTNTDFVSRLNDANTAATQNLSSIGFFGISRDNSSNYYQYNNDTFTTINNASTGLRNSNITGLALNGSTAFSNRVHSFAAFGEALTPAQATAFGKIIEKYIDTLGSPVAVLTGGTRLSNRPSTNKYDTSGNLWWSVDHGANVWGVAVDQNSNVYTGGSRVSNVTTRKYDSTANLLWSVDNGAAVWGVAVDQSGNVYTGGFWSGSNLTTRKYNSSGTLQWSADHGATVWDVAVDQSGNVYTGGGEFGSGNLTTRKYNSSGTLQWSVNHGAAVYGVAVDQSGNVYTGGVRTGNLTTRKYNSSGTLQWSADHGDRVSSIAVDKLGNVYTGGDRINNLTTRKYNSSGTLQWSVDQGVNRVHSIAVDKAGDVYTCGNTVGGITVRRYNNAGTLLQSWGRTVNDHSIDTFPPNKGAFLS